MKRISKKCYKNSMNILNFISLNRRTVYGGDTFCPFSQVEMAEIHDLTPAKVHRCIQYLSDWGYIEKEPQKCRKYKITESGREALKRVKK